MTPRCRFQGCEAAATEPGVWAKPSREASLTGVAAERERLHPPDNGPAWCSDHRDELRQLAADLDLDGLTARAKQGGDRGRAAKAEVVIRRQAPRERKAFHGTNGELADALLDLLALAGGEPLSRGALALRLGVAAPRLQRVAAPMIADGRVVQTGDGLALPED